MPMHYADEQMPVPPGPEMPMPGGEMGPEYQDVPPGPEEMIGSAPTPQAITVPGWIPAIPEIPVDETTCAEIGAVPATDNDGKPFCLVPPPA